MSEKFNQPKQEQEDFTQGLDYPLEKEAGFEGLMSGEISESKVEEEKIPTENQSETKYNFPEVMAELKLGMVSLVTQLKEAIEKGEYQTLISDDAAGRIPTLILRKILKEKSPNSRDLNTYFLAFGRGHNLDGNKIPDFIKKKKDNLGKTLIVTEFVHAGGTLRKIFWSFDESAEYDNYDIATVTMHKSEWSPINILNKPLENLGWNELDLREKMTKILEKHKLFIGVTADEPSYSGGKNNLRGLGGLEEENQHL